MIKKIPTCVLVLMLLLSGLLVVVGGGAMDEGEEVSAEKDEKLMQTSISDWHDLDKVRTNRGGNYVLINDLTPDTAGYLDYNDPATDGWLPIGEWDDEFTGSLDGQGYNVTGLYINRPSTDEVGLFGWTGTGALVTEIAMIDVNITGQNSVGGLIGYHSGGTVSYSYTTGTVYGENHGWDFMGLRVGGIIGTNNGGTVSNSYSTASVSGYGSIGGLVGENSHSTINKSYAAGLVSGTENTGGLVGDSTATDVFDSFWDTQTTGQSTSSGDGTGKTTSEMKTESTFTSAGWDFNNTWWMIEGETYPQLYYDFQTTPSAPENLTATGGDQQVLLSWDTPSDDGGSTITAYNIYRGTTSGGLSYNDSVDGSTTSYTDTGLTNGQTYYYNVSAVNSEGEGNYSGEANTTPIAPPSAPQGLQAVADVGQVNLTWSPPLDSGDSEVIDYYIYRDTTSGNLNYHDNVGENKTSYSDTGLPGGQTYYYQVSAVNSEGEGNKSEEVSATPESGSGGSGTPEDPFMIYDVLDLQNMSANLSAHYALANDIDANITSEWNGGAGFETIGDNNNIFTGSFDGQGYEIKGLYINRSSTDFIGLFGFVDGGEIRNVGLVDVDVSGGTYVGGLVGVNYRGTVENSYATGNLTGGSYVGCLVGYNGGTVNNSYSTGNVSGNSDVGGLVGVNLVGTVSNSYATGNVSGGSKVGGLIGRNGEYYRTEGGMVENSYATGNVSGGSKVGGLMGANYEEGTVSNSYATGTVSGGGNEVGGLVGHNFHKATVSNSYAIGNVSGGSKVGGLVGYNEDYATVSNSYATGNVSGGGSEVGGLVGHNSYYSKIENSYSIGTVSGEGNRTGGLVGYNWWGTVSNSYATGNVSGASYVGGLVGRNEEVINNSYATGDVNGDKYVGGLVGRSDHGTIENSYATGTASGDSSHVGGLVGDNYGGTVSNSYSTGPVSGTSYVGGLVGYNHYGTIENSYSTGAVSGGGTYVGGLVGYHDSTSTVKNSFWDNETSGLDSTPGGTGNTTAEMMTQSTFTNAGWNFTDTWWMVNGETRPFLRMEWNTKVGNSHQLQLMAMDLTDDYTLVQDINLTDYITDASRMWGTNLSVGAGFVPISTFTGSLDGQNFTINGLYIHRTATDYIGLLGKNEGEVRNVGVVDATVSGDSYVGGLVGCNYGSVSNSYAKGDVSGTDWGVGGLVGYNYGSVSNSYAKDNVSGTQWVGGLVGLNDGTVSNSYAKGNVFGKQWVGGLVGENGGTVSNSYATGTVTRKSGLTNTEFGGFVGINYEGKIIYCYSTGSVHYEGAVDPTNNGFSGSVVISGDYEMTGNFWDVETSGQTSTAGNATGKTTAEMMDINTFSDAGWNIIYIWEHNDEIWYIDQGNDYPRLWWEEYHLESFTINISLFAGGNSDGWNFVSFNLSPGDTSLTSILSDIEGNYDRLMYFDASTDQWQSYVPGRAAHFNNLHSWNHRMGIWICMTEDTTLTVEGYIPTSTDITLYPGWNMIGLPSETAGNHGLPLEVTKVGFFDATAEYNMDYDYNPADFNFEPGQGYMLYNDADEAVTWTVDY